MPRGRGVIAPYCGRGFPAPDLSFLRYPLVRFLSAVFLYLRALLVEAFVQGICFGRGYIGAMANHSFGGSLPSFFVFLAKFLANSRDMMTTGAVVIHDCRTVSRRFGIGMFTVLLLLRNISGHDGFF